MTTFSPSLAAADKDGDLLVTDFTSDSADLGWYVVNDNVMGGRSDGGFDVDEGTLVFSGRTNTRGGGFSSIRTRNVQLDLSGHAGIRVRVRGDGRRYTWRLTTDARWRGREVGYWADFETVDGAWTTVDIPFSAFIPQFRGYRLDGPELNIERIKGMGLMIYDKLDGPFRLHLDSVHAYEAPEPFSLEQYRWKSRVLVVSAPSSSDPQLAEQLQALAQTANEFEDRDMALVVLLDDGVSTAGDRELTGEESALARKAGSIEPGEFELRLFGKDGSVKLSRNAVTPMQEIYALIDTMPMRRFERASRGNDDVTTQE